ncbi:MAG: pyruvate kinase, partial [Chloroflexi bacterium]|nr:pyruvate kinase [Chloroflexota bacterium]
MSSNIASSSISRRTKIVCTIGPATSSTAAIKDLIQAGMDVARLNFSHGTHKEHATQIKALRKVAKQLGSPLAIMQDLPGPKNRTGKLKNGVIELKNNAYTVLTTKQIIGDEHQISIGLRDLPKNVKPGDSIFLADGTIELRVVSTTKTDIKCQVVDGGILGEDKGVNVPGINLSTPSVTKEDWEHLSFGLKHKVDFVALSFVRQAQDILKVKHFFRQKAASPAIIAKIERREALDNLDEILEATDGIMVARGDLGVEIPIQKVPLAQKNIVQKCNSLGKPVIVATQMLESMVNS